MLLDSPPPDATSGDPGTEFHKLPPPNPVAMDEVAKKLSGPQITALNALAAGQSIREAAKTSGVGRTTIYLWLRQDPNFQAAFNAWKEELLESGRARLLKGSDEAIQTLLKSIAEGDARSAVALLRGVGMLAATKPGLTDPAMVSRQLELDRRQQRVELAARSQEIAQGESDHLQHLTYEAQQEESRRRQLQMEEYDRQEAEERRLRKQEKARKRAIAEAVRFSAKHAEGKELAQETGNGEASGAPKAGAASSSGKSEHTSSQQ